MYAYILYVYMYIHTSSFTQDPFCTDHRFYVLIEVSGSNGVHDYEKLSTLRDYALKKNIAKEVVVARKDKEAKKFWYVCICKYVFLFHQAHSFLSTSVYPPAHTHAYA